MPPFSSQSPIPTFYRQTLLISSPKIILLFLKLPKHGIIQFFSFVSGFFHKNQDSSILSHVYTAYFYFIFMLICILFYYILFYCIVRKNIICFLLILYYQYKYLLWFYIIICILLYDYTTIWKAAPQFWLTDRVQKRCWSPGMSGSSRGSLECQGLC